MELRLARRVAVCPGSRSPTSRRHGTAPSDSAECPSRVGGGSFPQSPVDPASVTGKPQAHALRPQAQASRLLLELGTAFLSLPEDKGAKLTGRHHPGAAHSSPVTSSCVPHRRRPMTSLWWDSGQGGGAGTELSQKRRPHRGWGHLPGEGRLPGREQRRARAGSALPAAQRPVLARFYGCLWQEGRSDNGHSARQKWKGLRPSFRAQLNKGKLNSFSPPGSFQKLNKK